MDNRELAKNLIDDFGGANNLNEVINCMTRVRVRVKDPNKVSYDKIRSRKGVMGLVEGDQIQVVLGPGKSEKIAKAMAELSNTKFSEDTESISSQDNYEGQTDKQNLERLSLIHI